MHPASRALRTGSTEHLRSDLVDVLVEGEEEWRKDSRDLMMALAPFHDCARRLKADPAALFESAAAEGPESLREVVTAFGARTDVNPATFAFEVTQTADGPDYRSTW